MSEMNPHVEPPEQGGPNYSGTSYNDERDPVVAADLMPQVIEAAEERTMAVNDIAAELHGALVRQRHLDAARAADPTSVPEAEYRKAQAALKAAQAKYTDTHPKPYRP